MNGYLVRTVVPSRSLVFPAWSVMTSATNAASSLEYATVHTPSCPRMSSPARHMVGVACKTFYTERSDTSPDRKSGIFWSCSYRDPTRLPWPAHTAPRLGTCVLVHSICAHSALLPHPVRSTPSPRAPPPRHCTPSEAFCSRVPRRVRGTLLLLAHSSRCTCSGLPLPL